jgi:hypothetical protein
MQLETSGQVSENTQTVNLMEVLSMGTELFHTGGRADRHDGANSRFSQFSESLKYPSCAVTRVLRKFCAVYLAEPVPTRGRGSRYKLPWTGGLEGHLKPENFAYVLVLVVIYRLYELNHSGQALASFRFSLKILNQSALAENPQNFPTGPRTSSQRPWARTYNGRFISAYVESLLRME